MQASALRFPGSVTPGGSNAATTLALTFTQAGVPTQALRLIVPGEASTIYDARLLTLALSNGCNHAITSVQALFTDPAVPGAVIAYTAAVAVSAASGGQPGTGSVTIPISGGKLAFLGISAVFGTAPTSGTLSAVLTVEGAGAPATSLVGSRATDVLVSNATIAANGTSNTIGAAGSYATLGKYVKAIAVTVKATFNASATAGITVSLFASPDGSSWDDSTDPYAQFAPAFAAGATVQKTILVDAASGALDALGVQVKNNDGTYSVTAVTVTWQEVD